MIWEEYGQMAHQTLPNILLSNASLVTKSCIARFVDDDAFKPSAMSDCSTSPPRPPCGRLPTDRGRAGVELAGQLRGPE